MIDRVERLQRWARRLVDRSQWAAVLLGVHRTPAGAVVPGLVIVQIDGLSHEVLSDGLAAGQLPFVTHLLEEDHYRLHRLYPGLPSSTPAVQAELFYGVRQAVPAFAFVDHETGEVQRMSARHSATAVERRLAGHRSLVAGGSSYLNIYAGGAAEARFCMASLEWTDPFRTRHPLALPAIVVLYAADVVRIAVLAAAETVRAARDVLGAVGRRRGIGSELRYAAARVGITVGLRSFSVIGTTIDTARGVPVVHVNLLGYDEAGHERGPTSPPARRALGAIDGAVARVVRSARRSTHRLYDVWVLSDHGQQPAVPYADIHGEDVRAVVASAFDAAGLGPVTVTGQGPIGHVYPASPPAFAALEHMAETLTGSAGVPLVLAAAGPGAAVAWTAGGRFSLPADAAGVVGADHPYRAAVADDLVALTHHPDAGALVLSGWRPGEVTVSFRHEHGSHGGPGPGETDAFVLAPADTPLPARDGGPLRPADLRRAGFAVIDGTRQPSFDRPPASGQAVRVMTYNVHGCVGGDGRLSPERIAQVIARHRPDVVALQELDVRRARSGWVDQAHAIAEQLSMRLAFHPTVTLEEERFGDAVLSRLPMRLIKAGPLPRLLAHPRFEPRGAVWVEVTTPFGPLQVFNTHITLFPGERSLQLRALAGPGWVGAVTAGRPVVVCGDFNAGSWFPSFRGVTRRLRDVQRVRPDRSAPQPTFSGRLPLWRIDHVFADPSLEVAGVFVPGDSLTAVASDHRPLVADLMTRPSAPQGC